MILWAAKAWGALEWQTLRPTRADAIQVTERLLHDRWRKLYRRGWRVVRVEVREVGDGAGATAEGGEHA